MRVSELLRGVVGDFDPATGMFTVHQRKNRNAPAVRYVPLTPIGLAAYNALSADKKKGEPLCINIDGNPMSDVRYWLPTAIESVKLDDFKPHDMRHTAASRWVMQGVPLAAVAGYLGHRNIQMTMRYSHLLPGNHDRAIAAMMSYYETDGKGKSREQTDTRTDTETQKVQESQ
jgi:integrase